MKIRAFILLLSLSVYYLDVMAAVDVCNRMEKKTTSCKQSENKCSSQPEKQCPKEPGGDCSEICVTCPFLYNALMAHRFSMPLCSTQLRKTFPRYDVNLVNEYCANTWKPPNSFFI